MGFTSNLSFVRKNPITTAVVTIAMLTGTVFTISKTTPTAAIRNEKVFEFKSGSGTGIYGTGSGVLVMSGTLKIQRPTDIGWTLVSGADTACNTTCVHGCVFGFDNGAADAEAIVSCDGATSDVCLCAGPN